MMQNPNRRESLEQLHRDIDTTHAATENDTTRVMLGNVKTELQRVLTLPDEDQIEQHDTLTEQFQEAAAHLEADNPTLAAALRSAINILSNSGV
jgi:ribosomal protein RSM22 (predicted rRNA methylase)